jgi:hypothetical protein
MKWSQHVLCKCDHNNLMERDHMACYNNSSCEQYFVSNNISHIQNEFEVNFSEAQPINMRIMKVKRGKLLK